MALDVRAGAAALAGLVVLGAAGCAGSHARDVASAPAGPGAVGVTAEPVVAATSAAPTTCDTGALPTPTWTPPLVSAVTVRCPGDLTGTAPSNSAGASTHVATVIAYSLSGAANQETLQPPESMTAAGIDAGSYHPATDIELVVYPDPGAIDTGVTGPGISVSDVPLANGFTARVTHGSHGYGAVRVAWTDGTRSYLLLTTVMKTDTGPSGASLADMMAMAGSIPASR